MQARRKLKVGLIQMKAEPLPEANLKKAGERIRQAAQKGARVVCLQELFRTIYFPQAKARDHFELAESIPGPTTECLSQLARQLRIVIIAPIFERSGYDLYFNTAVVIDSDGELCGLYRKTHLPNDPGYYEKYYFTPGDLGFRSFDTRYGRLGVMICWDQWFPEAARATALAGAEILFYPTAIGWHSKEPKAERLSQREAWELVQRAHAISNGVFVAAVNRVGREGELTFWGNSFVAGPFGEIIASASGTREEVLIVGCDLDRIDRVREEWPFLRERRTEAYQPITAPYGLASDNRCHPEPPEGGLRMT